MLATAAAPPVTDQYWQYW